MTPQQPFKIPVKQPRSRFDVEQLKSFSEPRFSRLISFTNICTYEMFNTFIDILTDLKNYFNWFENKINHIFTSYMSIL